MMVAMFSKSKNFKSISKQLLSVVFTFYFSITIIMTLIHFIVEYYHTKDDIHSELKLISSTFKPSLEQSLWNLDTLQIESIVDGAIKLPTVLGIDIYNKNTKEIIYSKYKKTFQTKGADIFFYEIDLYYNFHNKKEYIGTIKYYSNSDVVLDRVELGFLIIFINSLLKSLLLTILFIWAFKKYLTKPLEDFTSNIYKIDLDKLNKHKPIVIDKTQNNELTFLGNAFNEMIQKLDQQLKNLHETQQHLVESEKMVALGNMVAGVAHEINTPIGMALTGITHLEDKTKHIQKLYNDENMSEEDFKNYLDDNIEINRSIQINLTKSAALIKSFKMVAVDQSSSEVRDINLGEYINEILLSLHNKIKATKIKVNVECDDIVVNINAGAISQIITNLIMNSLIHGFKQDEEGTIFIGATLSNNILNLVYKDNGIGLSKEVKKKLFEPFFTTKRSQGGSGLGTSIIYNLVTSGLHGKISVQSELNKGVEFNITIPIKKGKK